MRRFDCLLFDLGDTLIYFSGENWERMLAESNRQLGRRLVEAGLQLDEEAFVAAFSHRMRQYYAEREREFIEHTTAYILRSLLAEWGYPDPPDNLVRQAVQAMYTSSQRYWQVENDTLPTLETLRRQGYRLGIISNSADDHNTQSLIDAAGIREYFDFILSSSTAGIRKPNPRIFQMALEKMQVRPERTAMIGDVLGADVLGARNAGIFSIWITRRADKPGNRDHLDTIMPDATIETLSELPDLLSSFQG